MGSSAAKRLGIIGGTFNPVHLGHLLMAETALEQFQLQQVLWVPSYRSPYKAVEPLAFHHRWAMVQQAIAAHPKFVATAIAPNHHHDSYAISTLTELQTIYTNAEWYWIIGADAFQSLPQWHNSATIAAQCTWLVAPRHHCSTEAICQAVAAQFSDRFIQFRWYLLQMPQLDISSSLLRAYCQAGRSLRYLTPEPVRAYIHANSLYSAASLPQAQTFEPDPNC